ncbi:MAG: M3 family metallopeptidase [Rhodanobacteraceae bacterium]|nr:M3 family metallopeptidase [Rhodanobacteraceae bacterium]
MNPLLESSALPAFDRIAPEHVLPAIDACLSRYKERVEEVLAHAGKTPTWDSLMAPLEAEEAALEQAWGPVTHLHSVADSEALRKVYQPALDQITDFSSELGQHRGLFEAMKRLRQSPDFARLRRDQQAVIEHELRDFELSGVGLEEPARTRFREISRESAQLETAFEQAVMDATDAYVRPLSEAELAGIPESERAVLAQAAADHELEGHALSLQFPAYNAVITYADDRALRQEAYTAYGTRASDQGPQAGQFDNSPRIEQIMALRHEAARLLGYANPATLSLATKMAPTPERVLGFLRDIVGRARPAAQRELADLAAFARSECGIEDLQPWDVPYVSEKLRQARYQLSDEELKPYFPLPRVLEGLFGLTESLFGVRVLERAGVPVWHADVRYYELVDRDERVVAAFYLDAYARAKKRGGAWMDVCRTRFRRADGIERPVAYLTCNFAPPVGGKPSLLTHDDVTTLFHEFGHGLHHMLTQVEARGVSGISGVEWDAVELPSQFMENFCWTREGLDRFAAHVDTGAPMPEDLFRRLLATRHFHAGLFLVRQLEFGLFDFRLHLEFEPGQGARVLELLAEVREEVSVLKPPAWHRFPMSFGHVFAGGYAAGYYSYLWAEVLSADAYAAFEAAGVLDADTGAKFRREVLAVGGSRPALASFTAFRGREPQVDALLESYGLAA